MCDSVLQLICSWTPIFYRSHAIKYGNIIICDTIFAEILLFFFSIFFELLFVINIAFCAALFASFCAFPFFIATHTLLRGHILLLFFSSLFLLFFWLYIFLMKFLEQ